MLQLCNNFAVTLQQSCCNNPIYANEVCRKSGYRKVLANMIICSNFAAKFYHANEVCCKVAAHIYANEVCSNFAANLICMEKLCRKTCLLLICSKVAAN